MSSDGISAKSFTSPKIQQYDETNERDGPHVEGRPYAKYVRQRSPGLSTAGSHQLEPFNSFIPSPTRPLPPSRGFGR